MTATTQMINLFARLELVGIPKKFARQSLPDWWDNSIASSAAGLQQAQLYLAKTFNLDIASLANQEGVPRFRQVTHKFKMSKSVNEERLAASAHYATAIARLALQATKKEYKAPPFNPNEFREQILLSANCVDLPALLAWCNNAGIPILYIENLPAIKMMGLAIRMEGRFAIVLSRKGHQSEILFHLAHELGHIAKGHLSGDGFLVDEKIGADDRGDADEKEADAYAIRLLNGADAKYTSDERAISPEKLYRAALSLAKSQKIDAGHIILNYGHAQGEFPLAKAALKLVGGSDCTGTIVNTSLFKSLDSQRISEDQLALLQRATNFSAC